MRRIGSATHETRQAMADLALDNLEPALLGSTLRHRINPQVRRAELEAVLASMVGRA